MIKSNLSILLAERNLKITKISKDTGISRTTLTALYYNNAKGIQYDTMNTLCKYLKIQPESLFAFYPVDISVKHVISNTDITTADITLEISENGKTTEYKLFANIFKTDVTKSLADIDINIQTNNYDNKDNEYIIDILTKLPIFFKSDLEGEIIRELEVDICEKYSIVNTPIISIQWELD